MRSTDSSNNSSSYGGGDYSLAGYDIITEGDDYVMYRHQGSGRTFRVWKSAMPSRSKSSGTPNGDDNNNNSQINNNLNKAMDTTSTSTTTPPSNQEQRYTGGYAEFIKEREKVAKAAYLQMRHNIIERAVQERKRDMESRTVNLKDGRRVVLPRRSNDAVINMFANGSKFDRE